MPFWYGSLQSLWLYYAIDDVIERGRYLPRPGCTWRSSRRGGDD